MSQPTEYERQFDFVDYENDNPTEPKPGVQLEAELNAVKTTTDEIRTNLALIQRDDGQLKNLSVTVDTLAPSVRALFTVVTVRGAWVTATLYAVGDVVGDSGKGYICTVAHTSGTLATDVSAAKWIDLGGTAGTVSFTPAGTIAANTVQAAIEEVAAESQPLDTDLTAIAALTSAADKMPYSTGAGTWAMADLTAAGRELLNDASAAAQLTTLGGAGLAANTFAGVQTFGAAINEKKGADIASAGTINLDSATGNLVDVTGTTTITAITLSEGRERIVRFTGILTLTHGASSIVLPGGANITTAAGDFAIFRGYAAGAVRCVSYSRASGFVIARQPGDTLQTVNVQTGSVATGTTVLPFDDTIPQSGEGNEYMTLAITPAATANKLKIEVTIILSSSVGNNFTAALFQDSVADAIAAVVFVTASANQPITLSFTHFMAAGTTSPTTFKVRAGGSAAGTTTFNGSGGNRRYGGVAASSITITEIKA